jgi:hypothetical protein
VESHVLGVAMRVRLSAMGFGRITLPRVQFSYSSGIPARQAGADNIKRAVRLRGVQR